MKDFCVCVGVMLCFVGFADCMSYCMFDFFGG